MTDGHLRTSDAERDRAAAELGEHYAQGRLTTEEHAERLDLIWSSRTRGELAPVFRDLPGTAYAAPARATSSARPGLPALVFLVLAALLVVTVLTHLPFLLVGLLVWFFVVARRRNRRRVGRW
jgi:Flp pilus assembly protein TadB